MADNRETSSATVLARAQLIQKTAAADADAITVRLLLAERAAATGRFETFWPTPTPSRLPSITRRALQGWYVRVVENQLARGLTAPANSPIDGAEAEKTMAIVRARTGADSIIVVNLVIELARDARLVADRIAHGRKEYVDAALRGRISQLFRHSSPGHHDRDNSVGVRQALAEQWYARVFRAGAEPPLFRVDIPPITAAEGQAVAVSLSTGQAHVLYRDGRPIGPATPKGWRSHTARQWAAMSQKIKGAWLTERAFDAEFSRDSFHLLPLTLQSELLALYPPVQPVTSRRVATGSPREAAAEAFGAPAISSATARDLQLASILFSPRGTTIPREFVSDLPDGSAVRASLDALHIANHDRGEIRGHRLQRRFWADDNQRERAVELRTSGMTFQAIGAELGMTPDHVAQALREDSDIAAHLVDKQERTPWTEERVRVAAYLRSQGHTYNQIAAVFGYKEAGTIRSALTNHGPKLGIDPVTGHTYGPGEVMPDPHRWAPRTSPWDGSIRKEDLTYLAEQSRRAAKEAKASTRDRAKSRGVDIGDVLDRAVARRRLLSNMDPKPPDDERQSRRSDTPIDRPPHR